MIEEPWELPHGWRWIVLEDIASRPTETVLAASMPDKCFNYMGLENIEAHQCSEPAENWVKGSDVKSTCMVFHPGYVLYSKLRPYLNKAVVASRAGIATTELVPILTNPSAAMPSYIGWFLRSPSFVRYASTNTTGSRMPRMRTDALWQALIPLPPMEEQRRIVAKIEALLARVREAKSLRKKAQEGALAVLRSTLAEWFPRPGMPLRENGRWTQMRDLVRKPQYGYTAKAIGEPVGPRFLRITDIADYRVRWHEVPYCDCSEELLPKYQLQDGDILVARIGATTGKSFLVQSPPEAVFASYLIRFNTNERAMPEYLQYFMQSDSYWGQVDSLKGTRLKEGINAPQLLQLSVPLYPLEVQRQMVRGFDSVDEATQELGLLQRRTDAELDLLEPSILDRAFKGELL